MIPRILVVDDDPDMVELLRLALTDAGFSVRTAVNGQDALRKAQRSPLILWSSTCCCRG